MQQPAGLDLSGSIVWKFFSNGYVAVEILYKYLQESV
jgi:hypothetical protein